MAQSRVVEMCLQAPWVTVLMNMSTSSALKVPFPPVVMTNSCICDMGSQHFHGLTSAISCVCLQNTGVATGYSNKRNRSGLAAAITIIVIFVVKKKPKQIQFTCRTPGDMHIDIIKITSFNCVCNRHVCWHLTSPLLQKTTCFNSLRLTHRSNCSCKLRSSRQVLVYS